MQTLQSLFYVKFVLHVSGVIITHLQENKSKFSLILYLQHITLSTMNDIPMPVKRVIDFPQISKACFATDTQIRVSAILLSVMVADSWLHEAVCRQRGELWLTVCYIKLCKDRELICGLQLVT
jgi:hypothetical protein